MGGAEKVSVVHGSERMMVIQENDGDSERMMVIQKE